MFNGMGLNADASGEASSSSFRGAVFKSWVGGTLQFDLAAVLPGDWNHVVAAASPRWEYAAYSGTERGEAWMWEADDGENFNGVKFFGTYFAGYRMPLALNTVGLLVETEQNLGYVNRRASACTTRRASSPTLRKPPRRGNLLGLLSRGLLLRPAPVAGEVRR